MKTVAYTDKVMADFRNYDSPDRSTVDGFYRLNHRYQTYDFAVRKKREYQPERPGMGVWEACEMLNTLVDDSDPDTSLSQIEHLLQTAEAARGDDQPDWFVLAALIHDLGKILCLRGEPQWAVVGDTFPLGCPFDERVIYSEYFSENPDIENETFQRGTGIYEPHCGLDNVVMSWGHDEYMYLVARDYLPPEAAYLIRYHSFYAAHDRGAYDYLMSPYDRDMMPLLAKFSSYDLYSKADAPPEVENLAPYYRALIDRYFPAEIAW